MDRYTTAANRAHCPGARGPATAAEGRQPRTGRAEARQSGSRTSETSLSNLRLNRRFRKRHAGEAPVAQREDHRRIEPAHAIDPLHPGGELDFRHALGFDAGDALFFAFRSPAGSRKVFRMVDAHRFAQNHFADTSMVGCVAEQRVDMHGPDWKLRVSTEGKPRSE